MHTQLSGRAVVVCHSEPGAWNPPRYSTSLCPPGPDPYHGGNIVIGRTMFETDRLPEGWAERLNRMDYVWVPTQFHATVFAAGGVEKSKLVVVPEAVDTRFFTPDAEPLSYPVVTGFEGEQLYVFLSIFKWEERKGWKFLLEAFLREFRKEDKVVLWILTNAYHTDNDFQEKIDEYVTETLGLSREEATSGAPVRLLPEGVASADMPGLYKTADAFVLPSRGEGWGRPHCEAMAMGLPVIATTWSGPGEYMTTENSYPLHIDGLEPMNSPSFPGHQWAKPSVAHLGVLMREVWTDREEARRRGRQARHDMMTKYCPECLAEIVQRELARIT